MRKCADGANRATGARRAALASILALSTAAGASAIIVGDRALAAARSAPRWSGPPLVTPADPPTVDPDARIHALAGRLLPLAREIEPLAVEKDRLWEMAFALAGGVAAEDDEPDWHAALAAAQARVGYPAAYLAFAEASGAFTAGVEALARLRPVTLMGFVAKARVAQYAPHLAIGVGNDLVALGDATRA